MNDGTATGNGERRDAYVRRPEVVLAMLDLAERYWMAERAQGNEMSEVRTVVSR